MEPELSAIKLLQHQSGQHTPLCLRVDWKPRFTKASMAGQSLLGEIFRHPADREGWHTHHTRVSTNPTFPQSSCDLLPPPSCVLVLLLDPEPFPLLGLDPALSATAHLYSPPLHPRWSLQISISTKSASTWGFCLLKLSFPLLPPVSYLAWSFALEPISLISFFFFTCLDFIVIN